MIKKNILLAFFTVAICLFPLNINSLTFNIEYPSNQDSPLNEKNEFKQKKDLQFQANLEAGAKFEGMSSNFSGTKDFATLFLKPSFFINDFGIGFDFNFRFRNTPEFFQFYTSDYNYTEDAYLTFCKILNFIDFISYGKPNSPIYFKIGTTPYISVGDGLLFSQFHNRFFQPCDKEHGLYFHIDIDRVFTNASSGYLPQLSFMAYIPDIADPDILIVGSDFSVTSYIPIENLELDTALYFGFDFDVNENNLLNAKDFADVKYYRNPEWSDSVRTLTLPISLSYTFGKYAKISLSHETAFLWKNENFDVATSIKAKGEFIHLENSGFLLSIPFGVIFKTDGFYPGYFGFNYQNVRSMQYNNEKQLKNMLFQYGLSVSAFNKILDFGLILTSPFEMDVFTAMYEAYFTVNREADKASPIKVDASVRYRTAMSGMDINGSGGNFLESVSKKFRFALELNMRIYCSKLGISIGVQSPNWLENLPLVESTGAAGYARLLNNMKIVDLETYGKFLVKFMQLEVAIAF
jgi:hypothetical protein